MSSTTEEKNDKKFDGSPDKLEDLDRQMYRWARKEYGTKIGNGLWANEMPDFNAWDVNGLLFEQYCDGVLDVIMERKPSLAKALYDAARVKPFYTKAWHNIWVKKQYDKMFDQVESLCIDAASLEIQNLGMDEAPKLRARLHAQFGGSGDDVRAREQHYEAGMPAGAGQLPFPLNCNMEEKLRALESERLALLRMCKDVLRDKYEYGSETKLVKIVMRCLRGTPYQVDVDALTQEVKMRENLMARMPKLDPATNRLVLPVVVDEKVQDDWSYRNYSDDWLPSWNELKSKLISAYKANLFEIAAGGGAGRQGGGGRNGNRGGLPVMFVPGMGTNPKVRCFGCGSFGHRKGDEICAAAPNDWHECTPPKYKAKVLTGRGSGGGNRGGGGRGKGPRPSGIDGFTGQRGQGICYEFRDTGRCKFAEKCKFKHEGGSPSKKVKLTKTQKKGAQVAAMKALTEKLSAAAKADGKDMRKDEVAAYLSSLCFIKTIPRELQSAEWAEGALVIEVPAMATSSLLDMHRHVCHDSGSGTFITTDRRDVVNLDSSTKAKASVRIKGPSVGTPGCNGRAALIYMKYIDGVLYGVIGPDGVLAESPVGFRIASERLCGEMGLTFVGGKFNEGCKLSCERSGKEMPMNTAENILVMETDKRASDLKESPELTKIIDEVRRGERSPLVDLTGHLKSDGGGKVVASRSVNESSMSMSRNSYLAKFLLIASVCFIAGTLEVPAMIFNEAKTEPTERSRLWSRRLGHCNTALFHKMAKLPEYDGFPDLPACNEDSLVADLAKFKRAPFRRNDPGVTMDCPPWWRVFLDGYGGQGSLGGESMEGATGSYLFACCATGSCDSKLYASHEQFPVALHQFLCRVEADHFKCHVIYVDTHSVNLSVEAEEVCALFKVVIVPVSAGTPQEMSFAESMVRVIRGMSTAMMLNAPHLKPTDWALCDKYSVYLHDFMPVATRNYSCPWYLRTGRAVPWDVLCIHVMGAPGVYSPMGDPVHKRAALSEEANFMGIQWPAALMRRRTDDKVLSVSRKKIRIYEGAYTCPLDQRAAYDGSLPGMQEVVEDFTEEEGSSSSEKETRHRDIMDPEYSTPTPTQTHAPRPELDKNVVQSIKSLREHTFPLPGSRTDALPTSALDNSAAVEYGNFGGESEYVDSVCNDGSFQRLTELLEKAKAEAESLPKLSMRAQILSKLNAAKDVSEGVIRKGRLKIGKTAKKSDVANENIVDGKRKRVVSSSSSPSLKKLSPVTSDPLNKKKGQQKKLRVGDLVSLPATSFDDEPGSYSRENPEKCMGQVVKVNDDGLVEVKWLEDGSVDDVRLKDLTREVEKRNANFILVYLMEGQAVAFELQEKKIMPKNFFEVLVRTDWRKWVEAVKKELEGWIINDAVTVVDIADVPKSAKIVPLGELYTIKRDGRYKYRQYLMGNLLREGIDYKETFSTTVSGSGICTFFSLATTCQKEVWGWDAVCGYLQCKEQYDVYAFLPSHHEYSSLEYEDLGKLRTSFCTLVAEKGEAGLKQFAAKHRRETRQNPDQALKCNSSIYGAPSAGHTFEMLIHSVHIETCGCTQTQPEPSIFVRIVVSEDDIVVGYLVAAAFVDDLRFFGTIPEREKYMEQVSGKIKVTFDKPPVSEFVAIETYQCLETDTTELKMPRYWAKAAVGFKTLFENGLKARSVPITKYDEEQLAVEATDAEIAEARNLPFREMLGVMSFPSSCCKFEIKYAISICGSRRGGWSKRHFEVLKKIFEYGLHTCEIGLIYSKGIDPHGDNVLYAFADASLKLPRPHGCRIVFMNGAAISFRSKKHTITSPSSCAAEIIELFNCSTDVKGLRNLVKELGMCQQNATVIYQDNESAIRIANNRGSLGVTSRSLDLDTLTIRNRVEDQDVATKKRRTDWMVADMGTKALPETPFTMFRDVMNGYSLVAAAYPDKVLPSMIYKGNVENVTAALAVLQVKVMQMDGMVPDSEL